MLILSAAYGRNYKTAKSVKDDFAAEKDFIIRNFGHQYEGKPVNRQQLKGQTVQIRFDSDRKQTVIKVK